MKFVLPVGLLYHHCSYLTRKIRKRCCSPNTAATKVPTACGKATRESRPCAPSSKAAPPASKSSTTDVAEQMNNEEKSKYVKGELFRSSSTLSLTIQGKKLGEVDVRDAVAPVVRSDGQKRKRGSDGVVGLQVRIGQARRPHATVDAHLHARIARLERLRRSDDAGLRTSPDFVWHCRARWRLAKGAHGLAGLSTEPAADCVRNSAT